MQEHFALPSLWVLSSAITRMGELENRMYRHERGKRGTTGKVGGVGKRVTVEAPAPRPFR